MQHPVRFFVSLIMVLAISAAAIPVVTAHEASDIWVYNVWTPPALGEDATVSAVYMQIDNPGSHPLYLVSVTTNIAETVELHETVMESDTTKTQPVEFIEIAKDTTADLTPDGYQVRLSRLKQPLEAGTAFPLTLTFDMGNGETTDVLTAALVTEEAPIVSDLVIYNDWVRPAISGETATAGAYLTIDNRGEDDDRLIGVSANVSEVVELHKMEMSGDVMEMSPIKVLDIPAGEQTRLAPNGNHLMLIGLAEDVIVGQAIVVTLTFESGNELILALPVKAIADEEEYEHSSH
jgi:hypothetical protein